MQPSFTKLNVLFCCSECHHRSAALSQKSRNTQSCRDKRHSMKEDSQQAIRRLLVTGKLLLDAADNLHPQHSVSRHTPQAVTQLTHNSFSFANWSNVSLLRLQYCKVNFLLSASFLRYSQTNDFLYKCNYFCQKKNSFANSWYNLVYIFVTDTENLSKIAIHNFEKNQETKILKQLQKCWNTMFER